MTVTTLQVLEGYRESKTALQNLMTKVSQRAFVHDTYIEPDGYNALIGLLDQQNEEYYIAITQQYPVTNNLIPKLMDTYKDKAYLVVPDMLAQDTEINNYCSTQHRYLSTLNNLQIYTNNLETLWTRINNCDDYLGRQREFEIHDWEI